MRVRVFVQTLASSLNVSNLANVSNKNDSQRSDGIGAKEFVGEKKEEEEDNDDDGSSSSGLFV